MLNSAVVITTVVVLLLVVDQGAGQFWGRPQQEDEGVFSFWGRGQKEDQGAAAPYWGQSQKQQTRKQNSFQGKNRYYSQDYYYDDYEEYYGKLIGLFLHHSPKIYVSTIYLKN